MLLILRSVRNMDVRMLDLLLAPQTMTAISELERRLVRALRASAIAHRRGLRPLGAAAEKIGSLRAAAHLHLLIEEIAAAWPDPFALAPPCCERMSHDEATFVAMIRLGAAGDRPGLDRLLGEMIGDDGRDRLMLSCSVLSRVMADAGDG
jgi:hypothetical protein